MNELTESTVVTIEEAARKMTGSDKRSFEAQVAFDYLGASVRLPSSCVDFSVGCPI